MSDASCGGSRYRASPLRVLVITQVFWPENFRINDVVGELVARGNEVTVLTGLPNYPEGTLHRDYAADPAAYAEFKGAAITRVPIVLRGRSLFRLALNYFSFALSASLVGPWLLRGKRFDAILVYEPSPVTVGIPAIVFRRLKRAPVAFWVLDLWPDTLQAVGVVKSTLLLRAVGSLVSLIYNRCDLILAQSRSFIPHIRRYCTRNRDVVYFPNWAEAVFADEVDPASEVTPDPNAFTVLFAGNIGAAQDFPTILAAAELLKDRPNIRWIVLGDGRMADWVKGEVARRALEHCFFMLGKYPVERMPSFYKHASVALVSLKDDPIFAMTIPGKLQSYLAAGIPVLAMLNGEGAEVVQRAKAGIACPAGDAAGLAAAVVRLAELSSDELRKMGANGKSITKEEFHRETLLSFLERALNDMSRREAPA